MALAQPHMVPDAAPAALPRRVVMGLVGGVDGRGGACWGRDGRVPVAAAGAGARRCWSGGRVCRGRGAVLRSRRGVGQSGRAVGALRRAATGRLRGVCCGVRAPGAGPVPAGVESQSTTGRDGRPLLLRLPRWRVESGNGRADHHAAAVPVLIHTALRARAAAGLAARAGYRWAGPRRPVRRREGPSAAPAAAGGACSRASDVVGSRKALRAGGGARLAVEDGGGVDHYSIGQHPHREAVEVAVGWTEMRRPSRSKVCAMR